MGELEKSLDIPGLVAKLTHDNPASEQVVARTKELMDKELLSLSDDLTQHPEIGFEEQRSIGKLMAYLKPHGFNVEAMTALLYDFLTRPDYRARVKKEFDSIRALFSEYLDDLRKVYVKPSVPDPQ